MTDTLREAITSVRAAPGVQIMKHLDIIPTLCDEAERLVAEHETRKKVTARLIQDCKEAEAERDLLREALTEGSEFMEYLISHLPEDARNNQVWLKMRDALAAGKARSR